MPEGTENNNNNGGNGGGQQDPNANGGGTGSQQQQQQEHNLTSLPQWAQDIIKNTNAQVEQYKSKEEKDKADREKADQDRMVEQGKFKELAEKHEGRVKELEPLVGRLEKLTGHFNSQIEAEIKDWPEEARAFDPGKDDLDARMAWFDKAKPIAVKLKGAGAPPPPAAGNGKNPPPAGQQPNAAREQQKQKMQSSGMYSF